MGAEKRFIYQTVNVSVVNGTAAGTAKRTEVVIDARSAFCRGYLFNKYEGTDPIEVMLSNDAGTILDYQHSRSVEVNESVPLPDRYTPADIVGDARKLYVDVRPMVATTMTNSYQVVLKLELK